MAKIVIRSTKTEQKGTKAPAKKSGNWLTSFSDMLQTQSQQKHSDEVAQATAIMDGMLKAVDQASRLRDDELLETYMMINGRSHNTFQARELKQAYELYAKKLRNLILGRMKQGNAK